MQADVEAAEWPERFVYVCSAGGAANVNIVPMLRAGQRVAAVAILIGLSHPDNPDVNDQRFAIAPAQRIAAYAQKLGLNDDAVKTFKAHGDLIVAWQENAKDLAEFVIQHGGVAVFNLTGGRVATKIGTLLGLVAQEGVSVRYLTVGLEDFAVRLIGTDATGRMRERPLPLDDGVDLDTYLGTYGLVERAPTDRVAREKWHKTTKTIAGRYLAACRTPEFRELQMVILRKLPSDDINPPPLPFTLGLDPGQAEALRDLADGLADVDFFADHVVIRSERAFSFLQGIWLESCLWLSASETFARRNSVRLAASIEIARKTSKHLTEAEIDLVVLSNDQLSLVECKAIVGTRRLRKDIDALSARKAELCGQGGQAILLAPLLTDDQIKKGGHLAYARSRSVTLHYGTEAIDKTVEQLRRFHLPRG